MVAFMMIGHLVFQSLLISVGLGVTVMGVAASSSGGVSEQRRRLQNCGWSHRGKREHGVTVVWRSVEVLACVFTALAWCVRSAPIERR